jgi:hypothetical protein
VRTKEVVIKDNKLTMAMGIFDEYTMLNYLDVEAQAGASPTAEPTSPTGPTPTPGPSPTPNLGTERVFLPLVLQ